MPIINNSSQCSCCKVAHNGTDWKYDPDVGQVCPDCCDKLQIAGRTMRLLGYAAYCTEARCPPNRLKDINP